MTPTHTPTRPFRAAAVNLLHRCYRACLSPLFGDVCRFAPSCSEYARDAVIEHGVLRGAYLAVLRLSRCNPWCRGGYDPVPERRNRARAAAEL